MLFQKMSMYKAGLGISLSNIEKVENSVIHRPTSFPCLHSVIFWNKTRYPLHMAR